MMRHWIGDTRPATRVEREVALCRVCVRMSLASLVGRKSLSREKLMSQHYESLFTRDQSDLLSSQPDFWDSFFTLPVCLATRVARC